MWFAEASAETLLWYRLAIALRVSPDFTVYVDIRASSRFRNYRRARIASCRNSYAYM